MHRATFDLVWLGVLILTPGVGVPAGPVCPAFPLRFRLSLSAGGRVRPVGVVPGWPGTAGTRPPWHHPDRPDPTTRRQAQPEPKQPKWKSRADRPSRHAHTRGQDQNVDPDKIKCCVVHPGSAQPLVSQHLKVLRAARLVGTKSRGREVVYLLTDAHVAHIVRD